jgi:hypothetical protein
MLKGTGGRQEKKTVMSLTAGLAVGFGATFVATIAGDFDTAAAITGLAALLFFLVEVFSSSEESSLESLDESASEEEEALLSSFNAQCHTHKHRYTDDMG